MTNDERTGEFSYESYLEHLKARVSRANAELIGFADASASRVVSVGNPYTSQEQRDHYDIGFALGQMYLKKNEEGT